MQNKFIVNIFNFRRDMRQANLEYFAVGRGPWRSTVRDLSIPPTYLSVSPQVIGRLVNKEHIALGLIGIEVKKEHIALKGRDVSKEHIALGMIA